MKSALPTAEEIVSRGQRIYDDRLRQELELEHHGKIAVINIETGEYELDSQHRVAAERAHARWPGGLFYAVRIGYPALGHIGAKLREKAD